MKVSNRQKGFGFTTPFDGSRDAFVHSISAIDRARAGTSALPRGQRVSHDVVTERGKQAAS